MMNKKVVFSFLKFTMLLLKSFFFLFPLILFAQNTNEIELLLASKTTLSEKIISVDSIINLWVDNKKFDNINIQANDYIKWLYKNKKHNKTIELANIAINNQKHIQPTDSLLWQERTYYLGLSYYKKKDYHNSESAFIETVSLNIGNSLSAKTYSQLGRCYTKLGDYFSAVKHYKIAETFFKKNENKKSLLVNCINISQSYNKLFNASGHEEALNYLLKADSISKQIKISDSYDYYIKMCIGQMYNTNETLNISNAYNYFDKALLIATKNSDSAKVFNTLHHIGNLYNTTDTDKGLAYQTKALQWVSKNDSINLFSVNMELAYCYSIKNEFETSIKTYNKALTYLAVNNDWTSVKNTNYLYLLNLYKYLADIYLKYYKASVNLSSLNNALKAYTLADKILNKIVIESQEFQSKLFWRKQSAELYGKTIEACFLANNYEKAFYFMEKNKALLLTQHIKNQQLKQSLNLPDSIVKRGIELKRRIYNLKHLNTSNKDSINIAVLGTEYDLKKLNDSIQQEFKNYKPIDFKTDVIKLSELQNTIGDNEAILTYNISQYDDYSIITPENEYTPVIPNCEYGVKTFHPAYGLLVTKNHVQFFKLNNSEHLKSNVQQLIKMMRSPFKTTNDSKTYSKKAFELYTTLLPSKNVQDLIKNKKLRIIPDNYLHYLPFEALVTANSPEATYWIQENEISYAYSNSFLKEITAKNSRKTTSFIGFAPVNFNTFSLSSLQNSLDEINKVSDYFSGTTYTHKKATKAQFLKKLPEYDIIHLATHADAQDSISPWIAFTKNKLIQGELALTTNQAKMIVLSGCNTLLGKQEIGEGVMSLARGFFQSGAKSVVSSLWSVDDRSTAKIMNTFYKKLKEGKSKSASLRLAKLNYIKNHSLSETSPYYWATFVVLGDTKPLINSNFGKWSLLLLLFPFIFLCYFLIKKRFSVKNNKMKI